jgi:hypothetical protein
VVTAAADDPIRAEVERVLHAIVGAGLAAPGRLAAAVPRCVRRGASRVAPLAEPVRFVRSLVDLVARGGVAAPGDEHVEPATSVSPVETSAPATVPPADVAGDARPDADVHLPIEDYESLAASQVVDRLPTLTPDELAQLRAFEAAHRGRRTILGRIDQLLA